MDIRLVLNVEPSCSALSIKSLCNGPLNSCIPAKSRIYTMQVHCCRWKGCKDIFDSYESLFAHVSESHIGRKRQGNLCLDCKWDGCDFDCSKRDHIISHMKVHVPLKAFKCTKCPKAFKRAQDLSKHQRLHLSNLCESQRVAKYTFKSCGHYVHPQQHSTNPWSRNTDWVPYPLNVHDARIR